MSDKEFSPEESMHPDLGDLPSLEKVVGVLEQESQDQSKIAGGAKDPNIRYCPIHKRATGDGEIQVLGPGNVVCEYYVRGAYDRWSGCTIMEKNVPSSQSFCPYSGLKSLDDCASRMGA